MQEELNIEDYEIKMYKRDAKGRAPAELKQVHPLGHAPILTDGGVILAESGAIIGGYLYGLRTRNAETGTCRLYPR